MLNNLTNSEDINSNKLVLLVLQIITAHRRIYQKILCCTIQQRSKDMRFHVMVYEQMSNITYLSDKYSSNNKTSVV